MKLDEFAYFMVAIGLLLVLAILGTILKAWIYGHFIG